MKHPASRDFFAYWDRQRGAQAAPDRHRIEPGAVRHVLADSFVLAYGRGNGCPFRAAGTRLCALFGRDLIDAPFLDLWHPKSRGAIAELLAAAAAQSRPTVAGVTAVNDTGFLNLELLLLPFALRPHTPQRLTGLLAPLVPPAPGLVVRRGLTLTSWRDLATDQEQRDQPRVVRRWSLGSGFTVYQGRNHNA